MKKYKCPIEIWNKITDKLYFEICKKYDIEFKSNFSEYAAFIRIENKDIHFIYEEIEKLLRNEKNIQIRKSGKDSIDKNCIIINRL